MLISLHIENIAVIKAIDIDFDKGFSVLSGETGAGKSVIIDSINLLLGAKADKELIRHGESIAMVSGLFGEISEKTKEALRSFGIECSEDDTLLIQRTLNNDGRSVVKVNGRSVSLSVLKSIAPYLISIHGQSDTGTLTDPASHLEIIDVYAGNSELLGRYKTVYTELESVRSQINDIHRKEAERERLKEILEYQISDIDALSLHAGEEEELVDRKVKIKNSEKIVKHSEFAYKALRGSEKGSIAYLLDRSINALSQISGVLPAVSEFPEKLRDMLYQIEDIAEEIHESISDIEDDPTETLNMIEDRLDKISKLKRKYGLTVADILAFRDKAQAELSTLENSEDILKGLEKRERELYKDALSLADELHAARVKAANDLDSLVVETLEFLDMPKVVFFTSMREENSLGEKLLFSDGYDKVEFYISANRGAEAQSIAKVASGGELARIMLAIKSVVADKDGVSTVIYDEIDAGVSGKTARKIGVKLLLISRKIQVFCVTHSAQIASLADLHMLISKSDVNGATQTSVKDLDREGRISELSRILGGINVTQAQKAAAIDMLDERQSIADTILA